MGYKIKIFFESKQYYVLIGKILSYMLTPSSHQCLNLGHPQAH